MEIVEYLEKNQQIPFQIFKNALLKKKFFHAYLLSGTTGTPLLDIAKFLAKSMLCQNGNPFCCNKCNICKRVDSNHYGDLEIIDGSKGSILKEEMIFTFFGLLFGIFACFVFTPLLNNFLQNFFVVPTVINLNIITILFIFILLIILNFSLNLLTLKFQKRKNVCEELKEE